MKEGAPIEVAVEVLSDAPGHKAKKQRTSGPGPFVATLAACNPSPEQEAAWGFEAYGAADPQARGQQPLYLLSRQVRRRVAGRVVRADAACSAAAETGACCLQRVQRVSQRGRRLRNMRAAH